MSVCPHCGQDGCHRLTCPVPIANQVLRHLPSIADKASIVSPGGGRTQVEWHRWGIDIEVEWEPNRPIDLLVTFAPGQFEAVADAVAEIVAQAVDRPRRDLG